MIVCMIEKKHRAGCSGGTHKPKGKVLLFFSTLSLDIGMFLCSVGRFNSCIYGSS